MPRTVSASEAKMRLGALVDWVTEQKDVAIIENHGRPRAVVVPYEEFQRLAALSEDARRRDAWEQLEALRKEISAEVGDVPEDEIMEAADSLAREAIQRMIRDGRIQYSGQ